MGVGRAGSFRVKARHYRTVTQFGKRTNPPSAIGNAPAYEALAPITELLRHHFLHALRDGVPPASGHQPASCFPAIREWIPDDDAEPGGDLFDQRPESGKPVELLREDGTILILDPG